MDSNIYLLVFILALCTSIIWHFCITWCYITFVFAVVNWNCGRFVSWCDWSFLFNLNLIGGLFDCFVCLLYSWIVRYPFKQLNSVLNLYLPHTNDVTFDTKIQHSTNTLLIELNIYVTIMSLQLKSSQSHNHTTSIMFCFCELIWCFQRQDPYFKVDS